MEHGLVSKFYKKSIKMFLVDKLRSEKDEIQAMLDSESDQVQLYKQGMLSLIFKSRMKNVKRL